MKRFNYVHFHVIRLTLHYTIRGDIVLEKLRAVLLNMKHEQMTGHTLASLVLFSSDLDFLRALGHFSVGLRRSADLIIGL